MRIPRFLLTAGSSGSGKTLITCAVLQALKNRGLSVASFKCGPDYIDPMFHAKVIGTRGGNLDTFFTAPEVTRYLLKKNSQTCDIAVMEGVMGYYDGVAGISTQASAYDLACVTKTPAVLIVNAKGMSVSALAYIKGFQEFKEDSGICGVILNRISPMMYPRMKQMIEEQLGLLVYGYFPQMEDGVIESRHLGLVMPEEVMDLQEKMQKLAETAEKTIDLDGLLKLGSLAPKLSCADLKNEEKQEEKKRLRIGLALDEAFCFYYQENLELLREMGAELVPFSPVHDCKLPEQLDGMLLYGGYPELFGQQLMENETMRNQIAEALFGGMPVMAECGGFMYLHDSFEDMKGTICKGIGVISGRAYRTPRLSRFGYIELSGKTAFGKEIGICPAHEFHYFDSTNCGTDFMAQKPKSNRGWECIHSTDTMLAGFPHFYYYGNPRLPKVFLEACNKYRVRGKEGLDNK